VHRPSQDEEQTPKIPNTVTVSFVWGGGRDIARETAGAGAPGEPIVAGKTGMPLA